MGNALKRQLWVIKPDRVLYAPLGRASELPSTSLKSTLIEDGWRKIFRIQVHELILSPLLSTILFQRGWLLTDAKADHRLGVQSRRDSQIGCEYVLL